MNVHCYCFFFQVILPQASEEYGPISHYYIVVVPEDNNYFSMNPDQFLTDEVSSILKVTLSICLFL